MYVFSGSPKSLGDLDSSYGWKAPGSQIDLRDMVQELQGLHMSLAVGGSASALLEVQGSGAETKAAALISQSDVVVGALHFEGVGGTSGITFVSLRSDVRVAATAGYISISGATTAGDQILVLWFDKTGYSAY
jgi:hypothetical protein